MPNRDLLWTPFLFYLIRDVKRFLKVKVQTILSPLINQFLYLVIFGVSLGRVIKISDQFSYLHFIIPGLAAMSLIYQSFQNGSSSIFTMKITGEIIDIKSTALNLQQVILASAVSGLARGFIVSSLALALGEAFHFYFEGWFFPLESAGWFFVFSLLGGMTFAMLGFAVGIWSKTFDHIGAITGFVIQPLVYLGGVFYDLDTLSPFWQKASALNPLLYFVNGIRHSILGASDIPVFKAFIMVFIGFFAAYALACLSAASKEAFQRVS